MKHISLFILLFLISFPSTSSACSLSGVPVWYSAPSKVDSCIDYLEAVDKQILPRTRGEQWWLGDADGEYTIVSVLSNEEYQVIHPKFEVFRKYQYFSNYYSSEYCRTSSQLYVGYHEEIEPKICHIAWDYGARKTQQYVSKDTIINYPEPKLETPHKRALKNFTLLNTTSETVTGQYGDTKIITLEYCHNSLPDLKITSLLTLPPGIDPNDVDKNGWSIKDHDHFERVMKPVQHVIVEKKKCIQKNPEIAE